MTTTTQFIDGNKVVMKETATRCATLIQEPGSKTVKVLLEWNLFGDGFKTPTYFEPWAEMTEEQAEDLADRFVNGKGRWA